MGRPFCLKSRNIGTKTRHARRRKKCTRRFAADFPTLPRTPPVLRGRRPFITQLRNVSLSSHQTNLYNHTVGHRAEGLEKNDSHFYETVCFTESRVLFILLGGDLAKKACVSLLKASCGCFFVPCEVKRRVCRVLASQFCRDARFLRPFLWIGAVGRATIPRRDGHKEKQSRRRGREKSRRARPFFHFPSFY